MYRFLCKDIRTFQQNLHWKIVHDFVHDGSKLLDKNKKFYFQNHVCCFTSLFIYHPFLFCEGIYSISYDLSNNY